MGWVLLFALGLWLAGGRFGVSRQARTLVVAGIYLAALVATLALPQGDAMRAFLGGGPAPWLLLGGALLIVLGYRALLSRLKRRAEGQGSAETTPENAPLFADGERERYMRHIVLRELGGPGQQKLKRARVLVIGAGGLGSSALLYLNAAGVGTIGVIDADTVDATNLQRQVIHGDADIGQAKVRSAAETLKAQNPFTTIRPYTRALTPDIAADLFADYDLILDGTDNFETRYLANRAAVATGKPLISGALSQWEGQVSVFHPAAGAPCYQCIFPEAPAEGLAPSCAEAGVLSPLPGVVGSIMAVEGVKLLTGAGAALKGEMLIYDALWGETRKIALKPRPDCPVCGAHEEEVTR
ncbi:HesA/MoeB/ThiF family protein [Pseudooceanicola sp. HF7]|uniref:HesA/MoeB/ThiF family protein n=1 Tax=Pseudooceanicola sp. HF7 TaxID=2721560 RepID=UPI001430D436|nr:HesA/MoeB/ThiF family protein [Pseudooceanicola sp. HF7]NIZ08894.1 HesA/MoeB/ThiF family protein [Pseudooceanicola sp. HF7]